MFIEPATIKITLILSLSLLLSACSNHTIKQRVLMPANSSSMKDVNKLAVLGFSGDKDKKFSGRVEKFFTGIRVNNKPHFTVIDREILKSTLRKQVSASVGKQRAMAAMSGTSSAAILASNDTGLILSASDPMSIVGALLIDFAKWKKGKATVFGVPPEKKATPPPTRSGFSGADAIKLAKQSGADTVITGSVAGPYVKNTAYKEEKSECVERAKERTTTVLGLKVQKCLKYEKAIVSCVKQQGSINFNLKAVNIASGAITFSNNYTGSTENKYCGDNDNHKKKTYAMLSETVLSRAVSKIRNDVAPYRVVLSIELLDEDDSGLGKNKEAKKLLKSGLAFVKKSQLSAACDKFQMASESYSQSPAILYNLGVCSEIKNRLDEAAGFFKQAYDLSLKPNKVISSALLRVANRNNQQAQIDRQLREWTSETKTPNTHITSQ